MQIAAAGSFPSPALQASARPPEAVERGPDRDNDADDKQTAAVAQSQPATAFAGRGGKVNLMA